MRHKAEVLLRLDAPEICRLARLNHAFRGAAGGRLRVGGQAVGELPPPHRYVEGGGEEGKRRRHRAGTKEIYARLSRPVSFDDGTKEFWLEKSKVAKLFRLLGFNLVPPVFYQVRCNERRITLMYIYFQSRVSLPYRRPAPDVAKVRALRRDN
ncbi:hypothetical protein ZWY2020_046047 [Hordeum vulgare]|nr:hypothetical protein ZWY2020_046047 [Hordeum vulgare]